MTDPSSASWRRRRRGGKYRDASRRPDPNPLAPDAARRNRDAAFGHASRRRTWIGTSAGTSADPDGTSADSGPSAADSGPSVADSGPSVADSGPSAAQPSAGSSASSAEPQAAPSAEPQAAPSAEPPTDSPGRSAQTPSGHGRRAARPASAWRDRGAPAASASAGAGSAGAGSAGAASAGETGAPDDPQTDLWAVSDDDAAHGGSVEPTGPGESAPAAGSAPSPGTDERDAWTVRDEAGDGHEPRRDDRSEERP